METSAGACRKPELSWAKKRLTKNISEFLKRSIVTIKLALIVTKSLKSDVSLSDRGCAEI